MFKSQSNINNNIIIRGFAIVAKSTDVHATPVINNIGKKSTLTLALEKHKKTLKLYSQT